MHPNLDHAAYLTKLNHPAAARLQRRAEPTIADVARNLDAILAASQGFRDELSELRNRLELEETRRSRPGASDGPAQPHGGEEIVRLSSNRQARLLSKGASVSQLSREQARTTASELVDYVVGQVLGRKAVARGPSLVETGLAGLLIDDVRAATVIAEAGARTLVLEGPATATRITGDATVHQHTEGANDITVSDVTTDGVALDPKALVARVPLTAELVEDSVNLDMVLRTSLAAAFALKLDALTLATILADADVPDSSAAQSPAQWAKCLEAVGEAMAANQLMPTAMISNTADFIARAGQLASTAGTWLGKPPALASMAELTTTSLAAGTALYGGFDAAVMLVMRQELRLEVIRFHDPGRYSHELIAHMRGDGVLVQPKRLFKQLLTV